MTDLPEMCTEPSRGPARRRDVSVVICSYSDARWPRLADAVESVRQQTLPATEVIVVVDNNPSLAGRARRRWPSLTIVENAEEPGLSGARNSGLARATSEIVAFLDDDAVAAPDWLEQIVPVYDDVHVVAVGGAVEARWESAPPRWFPEEFHWVVGCSYAGMPGENAVVRNVIGANMSFRREALVAVGGFDQELGRLANRPLGCEETAACIRATQARTGALVLYRPSARVFHAVPASRATWRYFAQRCRAEGQSKAALTGLVGRDASLATERTYAMQTLPLAVGRNLSSAFGGDLGALGRAAAIVIGFALTSVGYLGRAIKVRLSSLPYLHARAAASKRTS